MPDSLSNRRLFERHRIQGNSYESFPHSDANAALRMEERLTEKLALCVPCASSDHGRRINNFCVGSDPEFVLVSPGNRKKTRAWDLGLKPGLAAGCDQNMRLAELRGWPTPSVVEHVAGIMASLRWLQRTVPDLADYHWRAGAYFDGDGIGGHVHFGRKRPNREAEIAALDGLAHTFYHCGFFDTIGWEKRREPDQHNNHGYGFLGDIRPQVHGYEYRSLPSWLCSPLKAFVVIAASKLAVIDPDLTRYWTNHKRGLDAGIEQIQRFARYFCGRDDDAWILKHLLSQPAFRQQAVLWQHPVQDFKLNWGFQHGEEQRNLTKLNKSGILPAVISPTKAEISEMGNHLQDLRPLTFSNENPTFVNVLPPNYSWMIKLLGHGLQYAGAGDLVHDVVQHKDCPIRVVFDRDMRISKDLMNGFSQAQRAQIFSVFPKVRVESGYNQSLQFDRASMGVAGIRKLREFLLDWGLFPFWRVSKVSPDSITKFLAVNKNVSAPKKRDRIIS